MNLWLENISISKKNLTLVEQHLFRKQQQKMLFHDKQQASDTYETSFTHFSIHTKKFTLGLFEKPLKNLHTNFLEQESAAREKWVHNF